MRRRGWFRLWFILSAGLLAAFAYIGLTHPNILLSNSGGWRCVPGTKVIETVQVLGGFIEPLPWQVAEEVKKMKLMNPNGDRTIDEMVARDLLRKEMSKDVQVFRCSSVGWFLLQIFYGIIASICLALAFRLVRWVIEGFGKADNAQTH